MKKIIKKLFTPFAVFAMALGIAVSVNAQKDVVGARAAPTTVTVVRSDFSGGPGYVKGTWSKGGISGEGVIYFDAKQYIQVSTTAGRQPYPHNTTATPGPITNISVTMPGTGSLRSLTPRVSSTAAVTSHTGGTALTAQTFTSNTQTLSWTISSADNIRYFQLVPGGNTNWASFSFTYEEVSQEFGLLDHITLDTANAKLNYYVGDAFNLSGLSVTAYDTVGFTKILSSGYTSDYDGYTFSQGDIGTKLVTVSYTEGEVTVTETFSINVAAAPVLQKFSKVTSLSQLHLGAQYVIAGTKSDVVWVMSTIQSANNRTAITATMNGSDIVETDQTQIFLLEEGSIDNTFAFKSINGDTSNQYIYSASSSNNYLRSKATIDGNASWRIGIDSGVISMISQGTNTRNNLRFNSQHNLFASYTGGQNAIDLYLDETTIPNPDAPSVVITSTDPRLSVGETATLVATTENAEGVLVSWSSSNELVATINSSTGLVTGVAVGSATITAKITVDEVDYTHTLVITIVPAYINADIATILEGDNVKTVAYTGIARIKGWGTSGADSSAGEYGNMLLVDLIGGAEIEVYGATANQSALVYSGTTGEYTYQSQTSFLTDDLTKDLAVGDVIEFVGVRNDYKDAKQLNLVILSQVSAYDEAEVFANWLMDHESGDIVTLDCEDKFLNAWDIWDTLSADAQDSFMNHADFADAVARIRMWAAANGFDWDVDFVGDSGSHLQITTVTNSPEKALQGVLIIGVFGLTTLMGYYFLRKRRVI